MDIEVAWFSPQSEYRPTEHLQSWVKFWFDDTLRLQAAKELQTQRLQRLKASWQQRALKEQGFVLDDARFEALLNQFNVQLTQAGDVTSLLMQEARLTKALFRLAVD